MARGILRPVERVNLLAVDPLRLQRWQGLSLRRRGDRDLVRRIHGLILGALGLGTAREAAARSSWGGRSRSGSAWTVGADGLESWSLRGDASSRGLILR